jgi:hypothetical protein
MWRFLSSSAAGRRKGNFAKWILRTGASGFLSSKRYSAKKIGGNQPSNLSYMVKEARANVK